MRWPEQLSKIWADLALMSSNCPGCIEASKTLVIRTKPGPNLQLKMLLCVYVTPLLRRIANLPKLELKTRPNQLLGCFSLAFALPDRGCGLTVY
jgi:hypothetical protein